VHDLKHLKKPWLRAAFSALMVLVLLGCGSDDKDKTGGTGPEGATTPITSANIDQVQGALQQNLAVAVAKGPGVHQGAVSGQVEVAIVAGKMVQTSASFTLNFADYSDDGEIWLDGGVAYRLAGADFFYDADLNFAGAYQGHIEGQVNLSNGQLGGFWTVGGQRFDLGLPPDGGGGGQNLPVAGGASRVPEGRFGAVLDVNGTTFQYLPDNAGVVIPITGLGAQRFLTMGGGGSGVPNSVQLRMIPINQTGNFTCGEGPNSFRIVHIWFIDQNGVSYRAGEGQGDCSITVSQVGAVYEGTFSGRVVSDAGDTITLSDGSFRNDGSSL
jgi:hypothetical protein